MWTVSTRGAKKMRVWTPAENKQQHNEVSLTAGDQTGSWWRSAPHALHPPLNLAARHTSANLPGVRRRISGRMDVRRQQQLTAPRRWDAGMYFWLVSAHHGLRELPLKWEPPSKPEQTWPLLLPPTMDRAHLDAQHPDQSACTMALCLSTHWGWNKDLAWIEDEVCFYTHQNMSKTKHLYQDTLVCHFEF